jgi:hypothetical protein
MAGPVEMQDARAAVDLAISQVSPWASDLELRHFAERRHLFWRNRCLEHARSLDEARKRIAELESALTEAEDLMCDGLTLVATVEWSDVDMRVWREQLRLTSEAIKRREQK